MNGILAVLAATHTHRAVDWVGVGLNVILVITLAIAVASVGAIIWSLLNPPEED